MRVHDHLTRRLGQLRAAGVAGFADPTGTDPDRFCTPVDGTHRIFDAPAYRALCPQPRASLHRLLGCRSVT